jgi:hypothetical protein
MRSKVLENVVMQEIFLLELSSSLNIQKAYVAIELLLFLGRYSCTAMAGVGLSYVMGKMPYVKKSLSQEEVERQLRVK